GAARQQRWPGARGRRGRTGPGRRPQRRLRQPGWDPAVRWALPQRHRQGRGRRPAGRVGRSAVMVITNVLATRYASSAMQQLWSAEHKIIIERQLWIAVLAAQRDLGVDFGGDDPDRVIADYRAVVEQVDLASIADRERVTRHDVKARIEEFNALAGHEHVHKGMTSRDLTENVEQLQVTQSLAIIDGKVIATLVQLCRIAVEWSDTAMAGRSHNVAAQMTTLGKRFATAADELLGARQRLADLRSRYRLRGIKGPVGTGQDMLDLLGGDADKLAELEQRIIAH